MMSLPEGSAELAAPVVVPRAERPPRAWKFIGTCLWGVFAFGAMFAGQLAVALYFLATSPHPFDLDAAREMLSGGVMISLSVMTGLPAALLALWLATRMARIPFAEYLALRGASWKYFLFGSIALIAVIAAWDGMSRLMGRDIAPGFMVDVLKSAQADHALWLLLVAFCIGAPVSEEFLVRGFLYRGWSESFLRPVGAIVLSSLVWTAMHLQYDWFFFGEIFCIGLLFGYMRYRTGSIWVTVFMHALNNLAATLQTLWLASQP
jgi:membrane protease YdiL (CAAX protease family)